MSYFAIGIRQPKHSENVGSLMRAAYSFGASFIFTIGKRYSGQASDTPKSYRQIPYIFFRSDEDFIEHLPPHARLVCVENSANARPIKHFCHFKNSIYLLGSEDNGLPRSYTDKFPTIILPTKLCINVSNAGCLVMFDRLQKATS